MAADPRMLELLSYYRDAELHGARLLLRLMQRLEDDPEAQVHLTLHVAEEMRHAWLWTKRITDLGGLPVKIAAGYQARIGKRTVPRAVADLLALSIVVEARSLARYREHAARPDVDEATRKVLEATAGDEQWHLEWMRAKLVALVANDPAEQARIDALTAQYQLIDDEVYREMSAEEAQAFRE